MIIVNIFKDLYTYFIAPVLNGDMLNAPDQYMYLWFCYLGIIVLTLSWVIDFMIRIHFFQKLYRFIIWNMKRKRAIQESQLQRKKEREIAQKAYYCQMDELLAIIDLKGR